MGTREESRNSSNTWNRFGMRLVASTACHPLEYAKVLIQIGYEPIAPRATTTLLGYPALALPNVFQYVGYIKSVDGFGGCYRGLIPKLMGNVLSLIASEKIAEEVGYPLPTDKEIEEDLTEHDRRKKFEKNLTRECIIHVSGIIVSHPFHVITVRMMAQFVGRELKYTSVLGSIAEIWQEEGLFGFFSGLVPRLLGDLACLLCASAATYYVNKHLVHDKEARGYVGAIATFITSTIMYPFQVVSNCMTVTGSGLAAGSPPHMPHYENWQQCWHHLKMRGDLKRGSSMLFRYWHAPLNNEPPMPIATARKININRR